ncbi:MAG: DUF4058 family protein [Chloroflexi bacterium]|nr:DUF4058 family protein [Chloroflexota bacterium]
MPLHHWPNPRVPWLSFHSHWIVRLVEYLNQDILPPGFRARPTELVVGIEPDVLLLQDADRPDAGLPTGPQTGLGEATLTATIPPPADLPLVGIYSSYDTSRLVAAIELVSPGNKDRTEAVVAFVEKVLFLLQEGVHVMVVDVVSAPRHPLRRDILGRLGRDEVVVETDRLWLASYCSLPSSAPRAQLEVREWARSVSVGQPLPALPLFLRADQLWVTVDLETTYAATLRAGRYEPA